MPDIVIVKKAYPKVSKRMKNRIWKLKHLEKDALGDNNVHASKKKSAN